MVERTNDKYQEWVANLDLALLGRYGITLADLYNTDEEVQYLFRAGKTIPESVDALENKFNLNPSLWS